MHKKHKKILVISFCIVFVMMSIWTAIMAIDTFHTDHCDIQDCSLCKIIHMSTGFLRNLGLIDFYVLVSIVTIALMRAVNSIIKNEKKLTLVELKVIQIK